jgi:hypothetical protein
LLNPYAAAAAAAAAAAQHMPDAQRIANTVWHTNSSSIGMASLKQSVPQSYFNSSSSSSSDQHAAHTQATGSQQQHQQQLRQTAVQNVEQLFWVEAAAVSDAAEEAAAEAAAAAAVADAADVLSPTQAAAAAKAEAGMLRNYGASLNSIGALPPLEFEVVPRRLQQQGSSAQLQQQYPGGSSSNSGEMLTVVAVHVGGEVDFQAFCKEFNFKDRVTTLRDHVLLEVGFWGSRV